MSCCLLRERLQEKKASSWSLITLWLAGNRPQCVIHQLWKQRWVISLLNFQNFLALICKMGIVIEVISLVSEIWTWLICIKCLMPFADCLFSYWWCFYCLTLLMSGNIRLQKFSLPLPQEFHNNLGCAIFLQCKLAPVKQLFELNQVTDRQMVAYKEKHMIRKGIAYSLLSCVWGSIMTGPFVTAEKWSPWPFAFCFCSVFMGW